ncbi:MAG: hydroxymethylglutaryl-CoA lyase [Halieaceae bacterium]|jgi:hydroxymethylglutaryl-CoA lyase
MTIPLRVSIFEVGPRDGLQNESATISLATKLQLIEGLAAAGVTRIEAGSFVNPKWIPQMADSEAVFTGIDRKPGVVYSALTPNLQGLERALAANVQEVAVFAAASESFSQKNINCSIAESLARFVPVMEQARVANIPVRGYVSCVVGCPYEGEVAPTVVARVAADLLAMGCYEISLGDTIGVGTPTKIQSLLEAVSQKVPVEQLAVHFHDTYGQALANTYAALLAGVATVDSSVAGLGGCPYAKGASGNVATEDVLYMLEGMGIATGIDLSQIIAVGNLISAELGRSNQSRVAQALSSPG